MFGALLLLRQLFPALETAGSLLFLAIGLAFLVSWLINRGMGSLYLGAIITALAAPDLLAAADVVEGPGVGTACLGVAFLFIAARAGGIGRGLGLAGGPRRHPVRDRRVEPRDPRPERPLLAADPRRRSAGSCCCGRTRAAGPRRSRPAGAAGASSPASARSSASASPSAMRTSSSSVITNGGPSRIASPSTPFALPGPRVEQQPALAGDPDDRLDQLRGARERLAGLAVADELHADHQAATADVADGRRARRGGRPAAPEPLALRGATPRRATPPRGSAAPRGRPSPRPAGAST